MPKSRDCCFKLLHTPHRTRFQGLVLIVWRVDGHNMTGVFFEIGFLDTVFNFGQAFFVFAVFGLDSELIIDPFVRA